jgi:hypothetical protein
MSDNLPLWMKLDLEEQHKTLSDRLAKIDELLNCKHELNRDFFSAMKSRVTCKHCSVDFEL